ncbi:hypothetical protein CR164_10670 [Prosthecochloris marina]|uniref:Uncharacterized protein n=1 Tax=Prosthecochloris marina TaxID=2017681 RepID=A0A317T7U3_9CHLB|nr:hypothetical protein CR164_10670 [Prosthecochloris marina]
MPFHPESCILQGKNSFFFNDFHLKKLFHYLPYLFSESDGERLPDSLFSRHCDTIDTLHSGQT